jgi:cell division protein FtsI (penicillin-binding protein 3)
VAEQPNHPWRPTLKRRLAVAAGVLLLWSVAIEVRLVYLQVFEYDFLLAWADQQQSDTIPLEAKRGDILDRNGAMLAYNVDADTVFAAPGKVEDPRKTINELCRVIETCTSQERDQYLRQLTRRDAKGRLKLSVRLKRAISPEQARRVTALQLKGISLDMESHRYYPNRELAAHIVGYVGDENTGLGGVERQYESLIGGEAGQRLVQVDAKGRPFSRVEKSATDGASVVLTIDKHIQHIAERELEAGVKSSGAEGGSVIVMDPFSGELQALANYPTFNPNLFKSYADGAKKNRAVQDVYEPGSTFKAVTAGAALEEKVAAPTELIPTSPGVIRFGARVINEAKGHNYGTLTFEDVIVKSSNIGAIKIGLRLGADRLSSYVSRFGFGARTSKSNFWGESRGIVWSAEKLTDSAVASVSMGYQVSVTPLQMASAFSAIANGGELIEPRVVREVIRDGVRTPSPRIVVRRVISPGTAKQLTTIMEGVVERGTAKTAQVEGFTIAGKTGTAAKALEGRGGYSTTDYNVSFVGFVPSREPQFTILVVIDSPHKVSPYGGTVAGPVFQKIAAAVLRHQGVPPSLNRPAPLLIARRDESRPSTALARPQSISGSADAAVVTLADNASASPAVFPNLVGMSARDAVRELTRLGLNLRLRGSGLVVNQRPVPGSSLDLIDAATLWLERRPRLESSIGEAKPRAADAAAVPRGRP